MSDLGLDLEQERNRHKGRSRSGKGCLAVLVAFAVLAGGAYFAYSAGMSALADRFRDPEDYPGPGTGSVLVEVMDGEGASDIGNTLEEQGVVASVEAFTDAAREEPDSRGIQVGFYELRTEMSAASALAVLMDPANMVQSTVTVPEGLTVEETVALLAKKTDLPAAKFRAVLSRPASIGLPSYAEKNPEGYLFPATYQVRPNATPRDILTMMVDRFDQASSSLELEKHAEGLGMSAHDVVTVASLIQAEARFADDFPRVARVIYNRLKEPMPLQFDSTVHYATGKDGSVGTSDEDRSSASAYNTYARAGLPPTPIMAPGEQAIAAALEPAEGSWLFFVTTNPDTGQTKFADSYEQHLRNKAAFDAWCAKAEKC